MDRTEDRGMWLSWLAFLAGLWFIVSPFILGFSSVTRPTNNAVIVGVVVAIAAFLTAFLMRGPAVLLSWLTALVGVWALISPFVLGFTSNMAALVNAVILGILIIVFAGGRALSLQAPMMEERRFGPTYTSEERPKKEEVEGEKRES